MTVSQPIDNLARDIGVDLLCLGATAKNAVSRVQPGSITQSILRTSVVPVLVVP